MDLEKENGWLSTQRYYPNTNCRCQGLRWKYEIVLGLCDDLDGWDGGSGCEGGPRGRGFKYIHRWFLSNLMKLWAMPCRDTQDRWVMMESSDEMWSTRDGNGKALQCSFLENPLNSMRRQKDRTLKDELLRSVGAQYATRVQWRHNSMKTEETEPKQKQHPTVDVTDDGSKAWCCKEQYCRGTGTLGP